MMLILGNAAAAAAAAARADAHAHLYTSLSCFSAQTPDPAFASFLSDLSLSLSLATVHPTSALI